MGTLFSDTLARARKEAGFQTAYRFYHDSGGAPVLKFSYRNYLLMEQGKFLPEIARFQKLLPALHLSPKTPRANELVVAWLKTLAGEEAYRDVLEPVVSARTGGAGIPPAHAALQRSLAGKKYHVTPEQLRLALSSLELFKCFTIVENDTGSWTAADIAGALGLKKPAAEKALKALAGAELVKETKKGVYRSRLAGMMVQLPHLNAMEPELREKFAKYREQLERSGRSEYSSQGIIRADADALRGFFPLLKSSMEAAQAYAVTEKTENSAFFYVVGRVVRLWNF